MLLTLQISKFLSLVLKPDTSHDRNSLLSYSSDIVPTAKLDPNNCIEMKRTKFEYKQRDYCIGIELLFLLANETFAFVYFCDEDPFHKKSYRWVAAENILFDKPEILTMNDAKEGQQVLARLWSKKRKDWFWVFGVVDKVYVNSSRVKVKFKRKSHANLFSVKNLRKF